MTSPARKSILTCQDLTIQYPGKSGQKIHNLTFEIVAGECFALVGRSGAGKTTITKALLGLHHSDVMISGRVQYRGQDLQTLNAKSWQQIRGRQIGYISQNPWSAFDPLRSVMDHILQAWACQGQKIARADVIDRLMMMGVPDPALKLDQYPHQWSGGMLQRASIVAALAHKPPLIIADEPSSALDADLSQSVIKVMRAYGAAILLISHDMGLVMANADRIGVLYQGEMVEVFEPNTVREKVHHMATQQYLSALEFSPLRRSSAHKARLLDWQNVSISHDQNQEPLLKSVHLSISQGEIIGLLGPSGSGKSSLLQAVIGLTDIVSGQTFYASSLKKPAAILPIFQDPSASLPLRWSVWQIVTEPLFAAHLKVTPKSERRRIARLLLDDVGLDMIDLDVRGWELSIGQRQRLCLARLELSQPVLIIADEPTSALDSISCQKVANLLGRLAEKGSAILLASHNRDFITQLCDRCYQIDPKKKQLSAAILSKKSPLQINEEGICG